METPKLPTFRRRRTNTGSEPCEGLRVKRKGISISKLFKLSSADEAERKIN
jgi:hypothetical protein